MAEEKTYNVYAFTGYTVYTFRRTRFNEISLEEGLKPISYHGYTTKDLWEGYVIRHSSFEKVYWGNGFATTLPYLKDKIAEGKTVIFPVSSAVYLDEVKNYLAMGFTVWFMKAKEFRDFKKDYKKVM